MKSGMKSYAQKAQNVTKKSHLPKTSNISHANNVKAAKPWGQLIWERPYVRPKICLPKSDPYSTVNFHEKSYPYSALFQSFSPIRAKILAIFPRKCGISASKLANFVPILPKNWPFTTISYPYSAVQCNFLFSYPYSALAEVWKTYP